MSLFVAVVADVGRCSPLAWPKNGPRLRRPKVHPSSRSKGGPDVTESLLFLTQCYTLHAIGATPASHAPSPW